MRQTKRKNEPLKHAKTNNRKRSKLGTFFLGVLGFFTVFFTTAAFVLSFMLAADFITESKARVLPSYAKEDLSATLQKTEWTEEDYRFLYQQTGLGKSALTALKGKDERILDFQDALFKQLEIKHVDAAPTTPHDYTDFAAPIAPLEDGDVFVTSTCHTFGWRNGHAALVTNAAMEGLLQSIAPGYLSSEESAYWFRTSANFMILRLKDVSKEERARIASNAKEHLTNIPYSLTVGIFSKKDQGNAPSATNCSHLVWQAYKACGYDIDSDGGAVCTARDIANFPLFEVVQVYGFDVEERWS